MRKRVGVEGCINFARLNLLTGCSRESDTRFEEVYLHADVDFLVVPSSLRYMKNMFRADLNFLGVKGPKQG